MSSADADLTARVARAYRAQGMESRAHLVELCGTPYVPYSIVTGGALVVEGGGTAYANPSCRVLLSACGGPRYSRFCDRAISMAANPQGQLHRLTLEMASKPTDGLAHRVRLLTHVFARVRHLRPWGSCIAGGCAVMEVAWPQPDRAAFPHLHLVVDVVGSLKKLEAQWLSFAGLPIWSAPADHPADAIWYAAKGFSRRKPKEGGPAVVPHVHATDEDLADLVSLIAERYQWRRMLGTWYRREPSALASAPAERHRRYSSSLPPLEQAVRGLAQRARIPLGTFLLDPVTGLVVPPDEIGWRPLKRPGAHT